MTDVYHVLTINLLEEIRNKTSFCVEPKADGVVASNFQGTIHITFLPYGIHVLKFGYASYDAIFDYEDPQLFEKIISKIDYLQNITCHIRNADMRKAAISNGQAGDL